MLFARSQDEFATTIISRPCRVAVLSLKYSLTRRLMRFLLTAFATDLFATARPSREVFELFLLAITLKKRSLVRQRDLNARLKSSGRDKRCCRVNRRLGLFTWNQADSRLRPFARRLASTRRPPTVAMRLRKPWRRLRIRTLGW